MRNKMTPILLSISLLANIGLLGYVIGQRTSLPPHPPGPLPMRLMHMSCDFTPEGREWVQNKMKESWLTMSPIMESHRQLDQQMATILEKDELDTVQLKNFLTQKNDAVRNEIHIITDQFYSTLKGLPLDDRKRVAEELKKGMGRPPRQPMMKGCDFN